MNGSVAERLAPLHRMASDAVRAGWKSQGIAGDAARASVKPAPTEEEAEPLRIALLLNAPGGGGISRVVIRLAIALHQRGCAVDLVVDRQRGKTYLAAGKLPPGIRVVDLGRPIRGGTLHSLRLLPALVRYLRRDRPALLLCHLTLVNGAVAPAQRLAPATRLVLVEHLPLPLPRSRNAALARHLRPWLYRQASAVVAVSEDLANDLAQQLRLPTVRAIYNPVVSDRLPALARAPLTHPWFQPDEPPVILAIGRLVPQKDFATLLQAVATLQPRRSLRLVILGEGPQRVELLALAAELGIAERVALPGYVDNPYAYLSRAAVLALSSRFEGLPTVLIEALACGCPVVATDCPHGPREILASDRYGQLVPVGDVVSLAAALETALAEPMDADWLRSRARDFTTAQAVERYLALIPPQRG